MRFGVGAMLAIQPELERFHKFITLHGWHISNPSTSNVSNQTLQLTFSGRFGFHGLTLLAGFTPQSFMEQLAKPHSRFVKLRLRISDRAAHDSRDLVVLVA